MQHYSITYEKLREKMPVLDYVLRSDISEQNIISRGVKYRIYAEYVSAYGFPTAFSLSFFESKPLVSCVLPEVLYVSEV